MAGRKLGKCGGCGSLVDVCSGCAQCIPRYICCNVEILEAGPYIELTECCETFGFRVPLLCDFNEDTGEWSRRYSGGGACPEGVGIDIDVNLMQDEYTQECFIRVNSTNLSFTQDYDGWDVGAAAIVFEGTDLSGNLLRVTIGCANVIENPLALPLCSPCSCLRCLPCKLCVQVAIPGRFFYDPDNNCEVTVDYIPPTYIAISAEWNGNGWTIPEQEITLDEQPDDPVLFNGSIEFWDLSDGCGIHIDFSMGGTTCFGASSYEMDLTMDNGIDPRRWGGTDCRSNEGIDESVGTPQLHPCPDDFPDCPSPQPQNYVSFIDEDFTLTNDDPYKLPLNAWVRIRDQSCGPCVACQEPIPETCCPDLPDELQMSVSNSSDGSTSSGTLNRTSGAEWTGSVILPNGNVLGITLNCDYEHRERAWHLIAGGGCAPENRTVSEYYADGDPFSPAVDCDAFEVEVQVLWHGSVDDCDMPISVTTITVTV